MVGRAKAAALAVALIPAVLASACATSEGVSPSSLSPEATTTDGASVASGPETTTTTAADDSSGGGSASPATATTGTTTPTTTTGASPAVRPPCSTDGLSYTLPVEPDLPDPVDRMRRDIAMAAMACDLEGLAALASPDGFQHAVSPGADPDPVAYWLEMEAGGFSPIRRLVEVLAIPAGFGLVDGTDVLFWPAVAAYPDWQAAPAADRQALEELFTPEDLARFEAENTYLGSRVAIDGDGDWLYYLPGEGD